MPIICGFTVGYRDSNEESRTKLGCPLGYMIITEGFRAKLRCLL